MRPTRLRPTAWLLPAVVSVADLLRDACGDLVEQAAGHGAAIDDPVLTASGTYRWRMFLPAGETADAKSVALDAAAPYRAADEPLAQLTRDVAKSHAHRGRRHGPVGRCPGSLASAR